MRILVTGGLGFIGNHLIPRLINDGHDVYNLQRYVTGKYVLGAQQIAKTVYGDLREPYQIMQIVKEVQPDTCIHLGALTAVSYSYEHPHEVTETNLMGTISLAESCLRIPHFKQFIFASTSETYGNGPTPKTEDTPQNPNSPYAVSKLACEKYLMYMKDAYDFPITILRPFNSFGRIDNKHFIVERTVTQMLEGKVVRLGDPSPIRDFLYVNDHVDAYLTCLGNPKAVGEVFNFCIGKGISIKQLVELIREITYFEGEINWGTIPQRPLDIDVLIGDNRKAKQVLGWSPKYSIEEGLKETVSWWKTILYEQLPLETESLEVQESFSKQDQ